MSQLVVDASVAVKWFVPEDHSSEARGLLEGGYSLVAPDLLLVEFANALLMKVRRGEIATDDLRASVTHLPSLARLQPAGALVRSAIEIALAHQQTVYDSVYVALALRDDCQFVTADRRLHNALAPHLPETMLWIEDVGAEA